MESSDRAAKLAAERDALELLRTIREQLHTDFSDEDREILARQWTAVEEPKPKHKIPFSGSSFAMVYSVFDPNTLGVEPRLVPCTLALAAFANAIENGLPGAEHETREFLRECGFDEAVAQEILRQMVARAPAPAPDELN